MSKPKHPVHANPWQALRQFTAARIALGRAGNSLPTAPQLDFQLAHARARDAVHLALDVEALASLLSKSGTAHALQCLKLHSAAANRHNYLQRPDLGRQLDATSRQQLLDLPTPVIPYDIAFVIADGLSALAIAQNAAAFLETMLRRLPPDDWHIAPLTIVSQGRVAVADEVGELLQARCTVILIGERPGLSSPDSMGIYLTWAPKVGLSDAARNCISNVRADGLSFEAAADKLDYLLTQARLRQMSGVELKDETTVETGIQTIPRANFLLGS